jgi:hypothetical protein
MISLPPFVRDIHALVILDRGVPGAPAVGAMGCQPVEVG